MEKKLINSSGDGALLVGLDVGSTTVKAVVMEPAEEGILWSDYQRHETRQPEKVLQFLKAIESHFRLPRERFRVFITGSGGSTIGPYVGAKYVQEVNAVSLAVEKLYPDAGSVIELGGQDAKIIIWVEDLKSGQRRKLPSMNDKCAGGTGAVIDKINAKLKLSSEALRALEFFNVKLHPVAGKCGVFAETDINGLQKQGVPSEELMASLFEAIVQQNLSVLTRGNTLRPRVLLLGGPNTFIPALQDAWKANIPRIWEERNVPLPPGIDPKELVVVPDNAQYYAAIGAALYGKEEEPHVGAYEGTAALEEFIEVGRKKLRVSSADKGLVSSPEEQKAFVEQFKLPPFLPPRFQPGQIVEAYIGIDGGSTSTKAVLLDRDGELLAKAYQLSKGNPLQDIKEIMAELRRQVESQGAVLRVLGVGTTGYAKDMLKETIGADVALVETVAHTCSALKYYKDVDVIVDVGGQDIKVIILNHGKVKDFRLNTQCSAGNGYFLQSTAQRFGYDISEFAEIAFQAQQLPIFSYGCAVFMESDIVNFQQLGWDPSEIMAGLAKVLPKNIWLYVVQEPNLSKFGKNFVLQGGTQHNLAAVKAQYDFIKSKVPDVRIHVHRFTGESGAIGAALEAMRVVPDGRTSFIGLEAAENLLFNATRDESTRCNFCKNKCLRTFVDTQTPRGDQRRFIIATCEKGAVESVDEMKAVYAQISQVKKANPNFVEIASREAFRSFQPRPADIPERFKLLGRINRRLNLITDRVVPGWGSGDADRVNPLVDLATRGRYGRYMALRKSRGTVRIGIPRVLNMYSFAPFFTAYIESVGMNPKNILFSDYTDEKLYKEGSRRGSIDQCFPSKVAISHVHNLAYHKKVDIIFFPILLNLPSDLTHTMGSDACPTVAATPEVVKAAFTKEVDIFAERGIKYYDPQFNMAEPNLFKHQLEQFFGELLGVTEEENEQAVEAGYRAMEEFTRVVLRRRARDVLEMLEREERVGVVLLGRPYHNDPGLNHEIVDEIQKKGYPVFTIDSLPQDEDIRERLFGDEVRGGEIAGPMDISDVWKNAYSENTSKKIWGAKYVARHPNLVALDLSNFKCGHDAPVYSVVEAILEATETPYFTFHDIDENKPAGSIKIRVETIDYFLKRYEEELRKEKLLEARLKEELRAYEEELRKTVDSQALVA